MAKQLKKVPGFDIFQFFPLFLQPPYGVLRSFPESGSS